MKNANLSIEEKCYNLLIYSFVIMTVIIWSEDWWSISLYPVLNSFLCSLNCLVCVMFNSFHYRKAILTGYIYNLYSIAKYSVIGEIVQLSCICISVYWYFLISVSVGRFTFFWMMCSFLKIKMLDHFQWYITEIHVTSMTF